MFIKFVDTDWFFLCNSYPCVLFESLSHEINQESHVYSWNFWKIYFVGTNKQVNKKINRLLSKGMFLTQLKKQIG